MFPEKRLNLGAEQIGVISSLVNLHLIEAKLVGQFVFAHKVYLVFAFSVPPAAYSRVLARGQHLRLEILLKGNAGERVEIPFDDLEQAWQLLLFNEVHVLVDEAEPEAEEAVVQAIEAISVRRLFACRHDL